MKKILFLLLFVSIPLFAQQYEKDWNKVIAFEMEGKTKSANNIVAKIHKKAIDHKNEVQIIKCFFYESKYMQVVDENAQTKIINNLKTEINKVSVPSKAILNLVYAKCLSDYYSQNQYLIYSRTNTVSLDDDFLTWTNSDFTNQIYFSLQNTLKNETILKATSLSKYEEIFDILTPEKFKKESLFDYLLQENIAFYTKKIEQWNIQKSKFLIYEKELLGKSTDFIKLNFDFIKDDNLKGTLVLYQKQEINFPSLENQFNRMQFCNTYLLDSKDGFMRSLNQLQKETKDSTLIQKIQFEKAVILNIQASKEKHPDYNIQAIAILDSIIKINNRSNAHKLASQKKIEINSKTLHIQLQKYSYTDENTRAFISYKNMDHLTISFYKIDQKTTKELIDSRHNKDDFANKIVKYKKAVVSKIYPLENKKNYLEYSTEVLLPQLKKGSYLISFESNTDTENKKAFAYEAITISDLAVLAWQKDKEENYQVLNRKTGKPIENVSLKTPTFSIKTDKNGIAVFERKNTNNYDYRYENIELAHEGDSIQFNKNYLNHFNPFANENETRAKIEFYLDRAIYRPGQTLYYKGVALFKKHNDTKIIANTVFKIKIKNANNQEIQSFDAVTNEFGSFSGEFVLPKTGLTGNFRIEAIGHYPYENKTIYDKIKGEKPLWDGSGFEYSQINFKVEEYKRPKFEISFEALKQIFQVNQTVTIKGSAKAFSGSNISDAKVQYEVKLTPYTLNNGYYYNQNSKSESILVGETKTDATGKFEINFIAKPFENATKEKFPIFEYVITARVTDINGETQKTYTVVNIGYHALKLTATIPQRIETKNKNEIILNSTNLQGDFLAAKGEVKIYFVRAFSNKFKKRIFPKPDIESISNENFEQLFPFEDNQKPLTEKDFGTLVFSKKIDTEKDKKLVLDFISDYQSGNYKVVFSAKDNFNNSIENTRDFQIIQSKEKRNPNQLFTINQINTNPVKDGFALIKITSAIPELYLSIKANYQSKLFFEENNLMQNGEITLKIPIKKVFEKTIKIGVECLFDNQIFNNELEIQLPKEEVNLDFLVESFRNKIQPGSLENWSFKLKAKNTTREAEILASMYDSSLDQFTKQNWKELNFQSNNYNYLNYKTNMGFEIIRTSLRNLTPNLTPLNLENEATQLMWFGFNFNDSFTALQLKEYQRQLNNKSKKPLNAKMISGIVSDGKKPLAGVSVIIKGIERGTHTDFDGYYQIEAAIGEELTFTYIGFETQKIKINTKTLDVKLKTSDNVLNEVVVVGYGSIKKKGFTGAVATMIEEDNTIYNSAGVEVKLEDTLQEKKSLEALTQVKARKNLSETAFFYPNLKTDSKGKVSFNFTSPEALTAWKLRLLAHNKEGASGYLEKNVITQKELMVTPNFPRFFREKDTIAITAKIANVTNEAKTGIAVLQLFDATTMQTIDAKMANISSIKNFNITAYGNTTVSWKIYIPEGLQGVQYKVLAKAGNFSDGEENILPVLTNNMLVTESIPIWVRENSKKEYTFENLKNNHSTTLKNHQFTLEYTSNPSWMAIQSLPYLMEYEHECAEQTFARFYANALASEIISSNPKIASLFETWRKNGKLNSKLEENEELKSIILAETPWLNDAQNEDEKKKNLALLFDLEKMKTSQEAVFDKLKQKQKSSGGFAWFDGSNESEYITRHILAGLGHLSKLSKNENIIDKTKQITTTGIPFLDQKFLENYKRNRPGKKDTEKLIWINPYSDLHYLYTRSFYLESQPLSDTLKKAVKMYIETTKKDWLSYSLYEKGLAALTLNRFGEKESANKIIESLKETSSNNEDWGMYWINNKAGWYWYQAPIETQALLIEAFSEVSNDTKSADAMKVWLLKNKQIKNWPTTKSTTEAIYALLMQGTDWLSVKDNTIVKIGDQKIVTKKLSENEKEAETGYVKLNWKADEIKKEMAVISIENKSKVPGFGGVYWQYFEDLDKIKTNSGAVLSVSKELYLKKSTDKGAILERISSNNPLKIGDLVTVRLLISAKEDMEFVHLKDMRASCFEPVNVLSEYQYKDRLGFYQSTKDAATHFFFDQINKGTYILEYDIRVNNLGDFSNGITTIESMYAPEFTSHTKGIRVNVSQ